MTKEQIIPNGERMVSSINGVGSIALREMVLEKLDSHMQKDKTGPPSYTIQKN